MAGTIKGDRLAKPDDLPKLNSERDVQSQFDATEPPLLDKGAVLFVTAESRNGQPNSCFNCVMFNASARTCTIFGEEICIDKFVWPSQPKEGEEQIEYWPVCGYHVFGRPNSGEAFYQKSLVSPDDADLIWINAPHPGQKWGGSNCGGANGGDNCDFFKTDGPPDEVAQGFCRVLQCPVAPGDCCSAWQDDDEVKWQTAQECLCNGADSGKKRLASDIIGRSEE